MLTQVELLSLSHLLRDERVLSVYVDGSGHDPAQQHAWRVELANALKAVRRSLEGSSHDERVAFDACVTSVDERSRLGRIRHAKRRALRGRDPGSDADARPVDHRHQPDTVPACVEADSPDSSGCCRRTQGPNL